MPARQPDRVGRKRRHVGSYRSGALQRSASGGVANSTTSDVSLLPFMRYMVNSNHPEGRGGKGGSRGRGRGTASSSRGRGDFSAFTADLSSSSQSDSDYKGSSSSSDLDSQECAQEEVHTTTATTTVRQFEEERDDDSVVETFEATVEVEDEVEVEVPIRKPFLPRSPSRKGKSKRWRSNDSFFEDDEDLLDDGGPMGGPMGYVRSSTQEWCEDNAGNGLMFTTTTTTAYQMEERDTTSNEDDDDDYDDRAISEMSEMMDRCLSISSSDDRLHSTSSTTTSSGRRVIRGVTLSSSPNPDMGITGTLTSSSHHSPPTLGSSATAYSTEGGDSLNSSFVMTEWNMSTPRSNITVTKRRSNSQGRLTPLTPSICPRRPASATSTPRFAPAPSPSSFFMSHASLMIDIASTLRTQHPGVVGRPKRARDDDSARRAHVAVPKDQEKETVRRMQADKATKHLIRSLRPKRDDYLLHVVIDLDETLVYARSGTILVRPYVSHLVKVLTQNNCEIILWTAGVPQYAEGIIEALNMACDVSPTTSPLIPSRRGWYHHLITRSAKWFDECAAGVKDLRRLGRRIDRTLIIENNPASVQLQTDSAILVQDYVVEDYNDVSLKIVADLIERCAEAARRSGPMTPSRVLQDAPEMQDITFSLAAEHCVSKEPSKVTTRGLLYVPPKHKKGPRCYAGEAPI